MENVDYKRVFLGTLQVLVWHTLEPSGDDFPLGLAEELFWAIAENARISYDGEALTIGDHSYQVANKKVADVLMNVISHVGDEFAD